MFISKYLRLCLIALSAVFLAGCKPVAVIAPVSPVQANAIVVFDGSGSKATNEGTSLISYKWTFSDGTTANGVKVKHAFSKTGSFSVRLDVTDSANNVGTAMKFVTVTSGSVKPVIISVYGTGGTIISNATVRVGGLTATTNNFGQASLKDVPDTQNVLISANATGYIPQVIETNFKDSATPAILISLHAISAAQKVTAIEQAQTLKATDLNAQVTLPANAFVDATGKAASGAASVQITPWNVKSNDLEAMLGNGQGIDETGKTGTLISAGMMTVDFYNAAGQHLQLAGGKTANIQMDLPYTSLGGRALAVGASIPLWHFSEENGVWIQQGNGSVIASSTSSTGLAISANVSHFSSWNWDIFAGNGTKTVDISCVRADQQTISFCDVRAAITLKDGSKITKLLSIRRLESTSIYNVPNDASITWNATYIDENGNGFSTVLVTDPTPNQVNIILQAARTQKIKCTLPDATAVACNLTRTSLNADGTIDNLGAFIPATGISVLAGSTTAEYSASTYVLSNNIYSNYKGKISAKTSDVEVNIPLKLMTDVSGEKSLYVSCAKSISSGETLDSCILTVYGYTFKTVDGVKIIDTSSALYYNPDLAAGYNVQIDVPANM